MRIETALKRYLLQLEADGRSPHTIGQYRRHVLLLARWARQEGLSGKVGDLDHQDIARFLVSPVARTRPDGRPKKATSTNALRSTLRTFFAYCHEAGYSVSNPARLVRRARCSPPPPRALSQQEQDRLLAALAEAEDAGGAPDVARDHALFHLMLATGVRVGSALAVERRDVDLDRGELLIRRVKGDAPDVVYLGREIRAHLRRYLKGRPDGALFTGQGRRPVTARHVARRLRQWLGRAGVERPASPHSLRHSFAMGLYARTGDVLLVRAALGHRSLTSTLVYAQADEGRLRAAMGA